MPRKITTRPTTTTQRPLVRASDGCERPPVSEEPPWLLHGPVSCCGRPLWAWVPPCPRRWPLKPGMAGGPRMEVSVTALASIPSAGKNKKSAKSRGPLHVRLGLSCPFLACLLAMATPARCAVPVHGCRPHIPHARAAGEPLPGAGSWSQSWSQWLTSVWVPGIRPGPHTYWTLERCS